MFVHNLQAQYSSFQFKIYQVQFFVASEGIFISSLKSDHFISYFTGVDGVSS